MSTLRTPTLLILLAASCGTAAAAGLNLGQPVTEADLSAWDISILPDGRGLPPGRGTAMQGERIYIEKCQSCHGVKGAGQPNDVLVGGHDTIASDKPAVKTVGSFWPYATTLFDYVRRAMPWQMPKSLSDDEVFAVSAYILHLNGIIGADEVMDRESLPKVRMPNRNGFKPYPATKLP